MAIPAGTNWEVQTGGSDTLNGGGFDTASTGKPTDGAVSSANTSAPVVTSASYNFVAGDVNNWWYQQAGTNSIPGWYKIVSVAANAATLDAAIGHAVLANGTPNTVVGCGTAASLTSQTWAIDYSQVAGVVFSLTGLTTAAANAIILTASATKAMVGNVIQITGGTNFTTGFYAITAASAGVSLTVDRTCTTAAGAAGTAGIGGALATPSQAFSIGVASNRYWIKTGSYTMSANPTMNAAGVNPSNTANPNWISGYNSLRGDAPKTTSRPTITAASTCTTILPLTTAGWWVEYLILDCATTVANSAITQSGQFSTFRYIQAINFKQFGISLSNSNPRSLVDRCEISGGTSAATAGINMGGAGRIYNCYVHGNLCSGIVIGGQDASIIASIIAGNTGTTSDGIQTQYGVTILNNVLRGNGRDGVRNTTQFNIAFLCRNNIFASNAVSAAGFGLNFASGLVPPSPDYDFNAYLTDTRNNCGSGANDVTLTVDPFTNAAGGDFSLNNTAGGGASCRAAGIPGGFPGLSTTTGYADIGAVQHADPGGGFAPTELFGLEAVCVGA